MKTELIILLEKIIDMLETFEVDVELDLSNPGHLETKKIIRVIHSTVTTFIFFIKHLI